MDKTNTKEAGRQMHPKSQPKWAQVLAIVLSTIAGSGLTLGIREKVAPPVSAEQCHAEVVTLNEHVARLEAERVGPLETRMTVLETRVNVTEQAHHDELQLKTLVQGLKDAWGPGSKRHE